MEGCSFAENIIFITCPPCVALRLLHGGPKYFKKSTILAIVAMLTSTGFLEIICTYIFFMLHLFWFVEALYVVARPCPRSSHIIIMTFECKDFLLLSLYRRPRSYKTVEQKTFSIFYYIIHWLCEWVYIFPFSKKYRWYFEFFFFFFQSVDDVKKHLKRWDLMHHGVKTQQSNAFGLFDYSLKAEGMLLEDVRRPPTPNHPTYTWGWRRRRSWWVEKGLLIKRGQKYLVTDRIVLETRGFWVLEVAFHGETKMFKASWRRLFFIFKLIFLN